MDKDFNFYKGFLIKNFSTIDGLSAQDKEIPKTGLGEIFEEVIFQISPEDLEEMELPCGEISYSLLDELFLSELEERLYVIENPEFMMEINKFILEEFDLRDAKNNNCKKLNPNIKKQRTNDLPF